VGLRTTKWKYMEVVGGSAPALFDLESDPAERRNLVASRPDVARDLRAELEAAMTGQQLGDRMSDEAAAVVESRLADLGYLE
jgi:arylsulfatase A-like enzyme